MHVIKIIVDFDIINHLAVQWLWVSVDLGASMRAYFFSPCSFHSQVLFCCCYSFLLRFVCVSPRLLSSECTNIISQNAATFYFVVPEIVFAINQYTDCIHKIHIHISIRTTNREKATQYLCIEVLCCIFFFFFFLFPHDFAIHLFFCP